MLHRRIRVLAILILACPSAALAVGVRFTTLPRDLQLFARDASDSAQVIVAGSVVSAGHDSVRLELFKSGRLVRSRSAALDYGGGGEAGFELGVGIHAELAEYRIDVLLDQELVARRDSLVCGDAYLISGQSNAVAEDQNGLSTGRNEWLRSFGSSALSGAECAADTSWGLAQGQWIYHHAAVGVWGYRLGKNLIDRHGIPIAILNGAQGGTPIVQFLRLDEDPMNLDTLYGRLLWRAEKAGIRRGVKGILWHQGEHDTDDQWSAYLYRFGTLWAAWQEDHSPSQLIYVFQIRPGCGYDHQSELREVQRELPARFSNVALMATVGLTGHDGCHYSYWGYRQMADGVSRLLDRDIYGASASLHIDPPNVIGVYYSSPDQDALSIQFDDEVLWPADSLGASLADYFALDGQWDRVLSGSIGGGGSTVVLQLAASSDATTVTYLPNVYYHGTEIVYEGPWLRNPLGIGALSFFEHPISVPGETPFGAGPEPGGTLVCRPSPSSSETRIHFSLPREAAIRLSVRDVAGRCVRGLVERSLGAGTHEVVWNGLDDAGRSVLSGVYFVSLQAQDWDTRRALVLLR